ncbi:MAG: reverse transcriptase family protein [Chitinophagales bacterium]
MINSSLRRLKVIQRRLINDVLVHLPLPSYAYGAVKERDNILNARRHQGKKYKFTTDLKNFFPSISHHHVFGMFTGFGFSPTVARVLTKLTTYKGRLPQGAPTSPIIANLVFTSTGRKLEKYASDRGITFTSFVDDLVFSAAHDFKLDTLKLLEIIKSDGYRISHDKTHYGCGDIVVTGLIPKQNGLAIPNSLRSKLANCENLKQAQLKGLMLYFERVKRVNKAE